jgi:hypothetical protein
VELQGKVKGHTVFNDGIAFLCRVTPKKSRCSLKVGSPRSKSRMMRFIDEVIQSCESAMELDGFSLLSLGVSSKLQGVFIGLQSSHTVFISSSFKALNLAVPFIIKGIPIII